MTKCLSAVLERLWCAGCVVTCHFNWLVVGWPQWYRVNSISSHKAERLKCDTCYRLIAKLCKRRSTSRANEMTRVSDAWSLDESEHVTALGIPNEAFSAIPWPSSPCLLTSEFAVDGLGEGLLEARVATACFQWSTASRAAWRDPSMAACETFAVTVAAHRQPDRARQEDDGAQETSTPLALH